MFLLGKKKRKKIDNTQPPSKLAFGAKFQFTGNVRDGGPGAWGLAVWQEVIQQLWGSNHTHTVSEDSALMLS